jgi:hypothetical protein
MNHNKRSYSMSKTKLTALAQILRLIDELADGEKQTLRDYLRPAVARKVSKSRGRKGEQAEAAGNGKDDANIPAG